MKRASIILILVTACVGVGWIVRSIVAPGYPSQWDDLELGMTQVEAKAAVPDLDPWLRDIKGFDQVGFEMGDSYWNLQVSYNDNGRVSEITKNYVDRKNGIFNRSLVEAGRK